MQDQVKHRYGRNRNETLYVSRSGRFTGACDMKKSLRKLNKYFWWPNKGTYFEEYINSCFVCQIKRNGNLCGIFGLYVILGPEK